MYNYHQQKDYKTHSDISMRPKNYLIVVVFSHLVKDIHFFPPFLGRLLLFFTCDAFLALDFFFDFLFFISFKFFLSSALFDLGLFAS